MSTSNHESSSIIHILIADDHDVVVEGIRHILTAEPDMYVYPEHVRDGNHLITTIRTLQPDIVLQDIMMPNFRVNIHLKQINALLPHAPRVIILTGHNDPIYVNECADAGAAGYLLKDELVTSRDLPLCIRTVYNGNTSFSQTAQQVLIRRPIYSLDLTEKQWEVFRRMCEGMSPQEIAIDLNTSIDAIRSTEGRIRKQLNVDTTRKAIALALKHKLINF